MKGKLMFLLGAISLAPVASHALAPPSNRAASAAAVTIPAGTQIPVRMIDPIDGKTATPGARYRASIDEPVRVGSVVAIPKGADCIVEVVNVQPGEGMALRMREVNAGGKAYGTSTEYTNVAAQGTSKKKKAARRGIGGGAVGAGIGAIAGGGTGAAIGAAIGGGGGAATAAASKGKQIQVPAESRLIFALKAPLPMR